MKFYTTTRQILSIFIFIIPAVVFGQTTFSYTGAMQTYTVPAGVTSIQIEAFGAQGGGVFGGNGGQAIAEVPVTPGATLEVYVGGQPLVQVGPGGFNGGGAVTVDPCGGGGGFPGGHFWLHNLNTWDGFTQLGIVIGCSCAFLALLGVSIAYLREKPRSYGWALVSLCIALLVLLSALGIYHV